MAGSPRKFYKTVVTVTVLSDTPYVYNDLPQLHFDITAGGCSGEVQCGPGIVLTGKRMAKALRGQGSAPSFFGLDDDGNDSE